MYNEIFFFFLPLLSRDRRPKARALASGNGLAGSCYGGRLKGRRKRRDDGGMSTIVFIRNPRSAVASFKRGMQTTLIRPCRAENHIKGT